MLAYASARRHQARAAFPEDPHECFEFHAAAALDLADRLQTPVFVMTDLDIGMNQRLCNPSRGTQREYDRGKVMTAEELEAGKDFGRYKDVDGDGIPLAHLPGTHPTKGSYFTRGTTRNPMPCIPSAARTTSTTWSGCSASSKPRLPAGAAAHLAPAAQKPTPLG